MPRWKLLFRDYKTWSGYFQQYNRPHACTIYIHSIQFVENGGAYVTFKTDGVVIDMDGEISLSLAVLLKALLSGLQ